MVESLTSESLLASYREIDAKFSSVASSIKMNQIVFDGTISKLPKKEPSFETSFGLKVFIDNSIPLDEIHMLNHKGELVDVIKVVQ